MDLLIDCLKRGTAPVRVVEFAREYLEAEGFVQFDPDAALNPAREGRFYLTPFPDVLMAFTSGKRKNPRQAPSLRMAFAHVDQPCLKIKGQPDFEQMGCAQLNVEVYGGMMDHTWFDRPLGLAGTVALRGEDLFHPGMVSYESQVPVAIIPGLAIHMNREANSGWKIDRQKELMPVVGLAGGRWTKKAFIHFLSVELNVDESEILSWDLNLYNYDEPQLVGIEQEFLSSPRIDNLASVSALLESLVDGERDGGINLIGLFDYEEVGSFAKSGADSQLLANVLRSIYDAIGVSEKTFLSVIKNGCYLSVDGAHAAHPNYPDRCDTTTRAYIGQGPAIKVSGTCKYVSDVRMQAILQGLAETYEIPVQVIADRNTIRGGATLGSMIASHLPMEGCDIGAPMWAMHSARETMACSDYQALCQLITAFFME